MRIDLNHLIQFEYMKKSVNTTINTMFHSKIFSIENWDQWTMTREGHLIKGEMQKTVVCWASNARWNSWFRGFIFWKSLNDKFSKNPRFSANILGQMFLSHFKSNHVKDFKHDQSCSCFYNWPVKKVKVKTLKIGYAVSLQSS